MLQKIFKEYRQNNYIIEVNYEWDDINKIYMTNFWITEENGGIKLHCIGECGILKDSAIICNIDSFLDEWVEYYNYTISKLEEIE